MNLRPCGYEPHELTTAPPRDADSILTDGTTFIKLLTVNLLVLDEFAGGNANSFGPAKEGMWCIGNLGCCEAVFDGQADLMDHL